MNAHSPPSSENRRLFDRIETEGIFIYEGETYPIKDISVGGLQLDGILAHSKKGSIVNGKIGLNQSSVRLYSDVICEVIENVDALGARLKFIEISEDFTEFLRSLAIRHNVPTTHKAGWLGSDSYQISEPNGIQSSKSLFAPLFRIESIIGIAILAIAAALLVRASSEQNFWVVAQHELISPVSGEVTWLHPDRTTLTGDTIATIALTTLSNEKLDFPIISRLNGQTLNWNFNIGDRIVEEDVLGVINLTPISEDGIKAIIGLQSPLLSLQPGDDLKVSSKAFGSMNASVSYTITPTQAAALTGLSADSFRFEEYFLVNIKAPTDAALAGHPSVDIFRSLLNRFF